MTQTAALDSLSGSHPLWATLLAAVWLAGSAVLPLQAASSPSPAPAEHFKPGDAVLISVLPDSSSILDGVYVIDGNGDIFLPIVGRLNVTSRTEDDLRRFVDSSFVKYLRYPTVRVERMVRLAFNGGFLKPGLYYVNPEVSLWDALAEAGGPQREDGFKKLYWVRDGEVVSRDMIPYLTAGNTLRQMGVASGDELRVTAKPLRTPWEVFIAEVLPVLALAISATATTLAIIDLAEED